MYEQAIGGPSGHFSLGPNGKLSIVTKAQREKLHSYSFVM
jgi:hypothetical protein